MYKIYNYHTNETERKDYRSIRLAKEEIRTRMEEDTPNEFQVLNSKGKPVAGTMEWNTLDGYDIEDRSYQEVFIQWGDRAVVEWRTIKN